MKRAAFLVVFLAAKVAAGQTAAPPAPEGDGRAQYPPILANSFFSISAGYINYPFSDLQLEPGHRVESIQVPHVAARAALFGHHFSKYVSAQATYMRPVKYVRYVKVDGSPDSHTVWTHFGTITLLAHAPLTPRFSIFGETGMAITNRNGFELGEASVVKDLHFTSLMYGGGVEYRLSDAVDVVGSSTFIPARANGHQPHTVFTSGGFRFNMRPLRQEQVAATVAAGVIVPKHLVQAAFTSDAVGFGLNNFVSKTVPIFYGGNVQVRHSVFSITYQRNLFHTKKIFAFDLGGSVGQWTSRADGQVFRTASIFPLARFTLLRRRAADIYFGYALAGPSYISKEIVDGLDLGGHFTFQDFMALGMFAGAQRHFNFELNLNHYSNGNMLRDNAGVMIPLAFKVGYAF